MSDPALLARTADRLRKVPGFIAFELDRYQQLTGVNPGTDFDLSEALLVKLGLCRRPRPDHYLADLAAVGDKVGVPTGTVANLLRASDAVTALATWGEAASSRATSGNTGLLSAARDHTEEHTPFEEPHGPESTLPGWLVSAVDRFWGEAAGAGAFPRDLHLPILTNLPLAIIEVDGLTVRRLDQWLHQHHLPPLATAADRALRGCLLAYAGIGLLVVDRTDDPQQRRLTLAHEAAHFIVDYLTPREQVAQRRPELLDVLDGEREPTNAERFDALLADVPMGFHTHLLERDTRGGHLSVAAAEVEDRAERLALELLAPLQRVLDDLAAEDDPDTPRVLRERFGLPAGVAARYTSHIDRYRSQRPRTLLEAIGLAPAERDDTDDQRDEQPGDES